MADEALEFNLDGSMDDIADLASFETWPSGAYICHYDSWEMKEVGEHKAITRNLILDEVKAIKEDLTIPHPETGESTVPPKPGDVMGDMYLVDNPTGLGFLKKAVLEPLKKKYGDGSIRQLLEQGKNKPMLIVFSRKWNEKKARYFGSIQTSAYMG